ncbi:GNAT family N-acetyltransferase [Sansalvadorimonas sp. 2012CJ34-2]|uniref:GNAT family N-acetyltransferase n=1 Tax=Parendozoicomonas callyspongiae TaxID=2942213 RepID=A0ABT0PFR4_9GAMM|nr:GNAT family N-acetyltransferase [Sansalvadorimonas sp. 2012CJ34-2]MCL6269587.1 GNAT family N-acetyltransferase [Sansalvadorimonas sp. 2012CJ34-2]
MRISSVSHDQIPIELLLEADPSEAKIQSYLPGSTCFAVEDGEKIVAVCVLIPLSSTSWELINIAVDPSCQGSGVGSKLLKHALSEMKKLGIKRVELGTGSFGYQLTFYQRAGFRVFAVDRDFFLNNYDEPLFENGLQHKDMLRLAIEF